MARLMIGLKVTGVVALTLCAAGNALLGDWGSLALAAATAVLLAVM
jgi:hypothetical protein